ncbi:Predicted dehydrogenase [Salegentibacter echinorum]|uniref:Predicted dehydrogenase n=1 Tax=Salegentibacter echinorum TaxID=1073325 RepID=A0A1M5FI52_SALEC|nr:Gfo/Idh/MocA family oxidoreductase [Salegentibacter echinorum]SHF91099.1 Predicted dehydrogenase [Salegentibacter echinorum]
MKVLIIGLGSIAKKHIAALRKNWEVSVYALRSSAKSNSLDGVTDLYSTNELDELQFDFFIISNPTSKHAEAIEKILKYKKPLFIEKPLFDKIGTSNQALISRINNDKIPNYVACNLRFLDCLQEAKKMIAGLRINEINSYCGSYLPNWRPDVDFRKSYSANKEMGGGVHIDLIHELDYLYWFLGMPKKSNTKFTSQSHLDISAVDYANYLLEYDGFCASVILNYYRKEPKRTLEIVTSQATFVVNLLENKIFENGKEVYASSQKILDTYEVQMNFFLKNILVKDDFNEFNTVNEAYKILALCMEN